MDQDWSEWLITRAFNSHRRYFDARRRASVDDGAVSIDLLMGDEGDDFIDGARSGDDTCLRDDDDYAGRVDGK